MKTTEQYIPYDYAALIKRKQEERIRAEKRLREIKEQERMERIRYGLYETSKKKSHVGRKVAVGGALAGYGCLRVIANLTKRYM